MEVKFVNSLHVESVSKHTWRLFSDLLIDVEGMLIRVPQGFITDFASVPRLPFAYWIAGNRAPKSATLHDYLYSVKTVSRDHADEIFYYAMLAEGLQKWIAKLMWSGVRFGGAKRYGAR